MMDRARSAPPERTRLAEVLGAFSLASDMAIGLPAEHGLRACYISMRLAGEIELPAQERDDLYYAGLVKNGGCSCSASQMATFLAGDEMAAIADLATRNQDDELAMLGWVTQHVASGAPFATRARRILDFLVHSRDLERDGAAGECEVAQRIASRLQLSHTVQNALGSCLERWDGKGMPRSIRGEAIPLIARMMSMAALVEVFHRTAGRRAAEKMALERKGKDLRPARGRCVPCTVREPRLLGGPGRREERLGDGAVHGARLQRPLYRRGAAR